MTKQLAEMTLEELWELFPISLVPHNPQWTDYFDEIAEELQETLTQFSVIRISHIGSTAIPDIWAKNIVDVLVEVGDDTNLAEVARKLENNGFIRMSESDNRISLNRGYTPNGFTEKVYHIHLRHTGDNGELYFRDYLAEHADIAHEYEKLKLNLWKKHEHNRDAYTDEKTDFVNKWTEVAKVEYTDRY